MGMELLPAQYPKASACIAGRPANLDVLLDHCWEPQFGGRLCVAGECIIGNDVIQDASSAFWELA
jgi:hypothetical protein